MIIGASLVTAFGAAVLATLLYCVITNAWNWRTFAAMVVFGTILVFVALSGPIRIGSAVMEHTLGILRHSIS